MICHQPTKTGQKNRPLWTTGKMTNKHSKRSQRLTRWLFGTNTDPHEPGPTTAKTIVAWVVQNLRPVPLQTWQMAATTGAEQSCAKRPWKIAAEIAGTGPHNHKVVTRDGGSAGRGAAKTGFCSP
jgi:hypothetical protein